MFVRWFIHELHQTNNARSTGDVAHDDVVVYILFQVLVEQSRGSIGRTTHGPWINNLKIGSGYPVFIDHCCLVAAAVQE